MIFSNPSSSTKNPHANRSFAESLHHKPTLRYCKHCNKVLLYWARWQVTHVIVKDRAMVIKKCSSLFFLGIDCIDQRLPALFYSLFILNDLLLEQMEEAQIVRYRTGEEFSWHYDEKQIDQLDNLNTIKKGVAVERYFVI